MGPPGGADPAIIIASLALLGTLPLWLVLALALTSLVPGRFRLPRVVLLLAVYLLWETSMLVALFVLWVASGFGWKLRAPAFQAAHYRLGRVGLDVLFAIFGRVLRLDIVTEGSDDGDPGRSAQAFRELLGPGSPLVVASRHGGPGDSFILIHTLLSTANREPRIVLKYTLQWDPTIDVLLNRVPTRFITPTGFGKNRRGGGKHVEEEIASLAQGLDDDDALVIFPEGGQVSARRRSNRIERLRTTGHADLADRAERLQHVMPPQPGGVYRALEGAPDADIVLIGHTGLDRLHTLGDIWHELPMDKRLTMRAWRVPRAQVPADRGEQAAWLFAWFETIDDWIVEQGQLDDTPPPTPA